MWLNHMPAFFMNDEMNPVQYDSYFLIFISDFDILNHRGVRYNNVNEIK